MLLYLFIVLKYLIKSKLIIIKLVFYLIKNYLQFILLIYLYFLFIQILDKILFSSFNLQFLILFFINFTFLNEVLLLIIYEPVLLSLVEESD